MALVRPQTQRARLAQSGIPRRSLPDHLAVKRSSRKEARDIISISPYRLRYHPPRRRASRNQFAPMVEPFLAGRAASSRLSAEHEPGQELL
jgi:hypothetical protein